MSTVLWANRLIDGAVISDQTDKYAMHMHLSKIDEIARGAGLMALSEICDTTDLRFNIEDLSLPEGMASTNEWMAAQGVWVDAGIAASQLAALIDAIETRKPRFGLIRNDCEAVVAELRESLSFAREAAAQAAKFNFAIVM